MAVETLHGDDTIVEELTQIDRPKPAIADLPLRVEPVCGGFELFVGEDWWEERD